MALLKKMNETQFDQTGISNGACVRAKYKDWSNFKNGFVTEISSDTIKVLYYVSEGNSSNYFDINVKDVESGLWQIFWTQDMITINKEEVLN